jgi:tetratricopeptide repeat protein 30
MIKYDKNELQNSARILAENCLQTEQDVKVVQASILFKERKYEDACQKFVEAISSEGYQPHIAYNIALCHFLAKQYVLSLKSIEDIQEKAIREHSGLYIIIIICCCCCVC